MPLVSLKRQASTADKQEMLHAHILLPWYMNLVILANWRAFFASQSANISLRLNFPILSLQGLKNESPKIEKHPGTVISSKVIVASPSLFPTVQRLHVFGVRSKTGR
ncbi:Uncharacterized protein Fot_18325 [Forsythia ovata]|uniref:Uncharacterized protein n=1 Tax=Forsythia ovata TaxID=205694 RepID=A0ABD1VHV9_9LAMI